MTEQAEAGLKKHPFTFLVLLWAVYICCKVLSSTWRVRVIGMDRRRRAVAASPGKTFLIASFHESAVTGVLVHPGQKICNMVSRSKDGELVAFLSEKLGLASVRGSSSRGGKDVRDAMIEKVMSGFIGAITVDGPRGPRRVLKNGVVDIARKTGAPVLPTTCVGDPMWVLKKTWDQTRVPKPFARVLVYYGEPIVVPKAVNDEQFKDYLTKITDALNKDDDLVKLRFDEIWPHAMS